MKPVKYIVFSVISAALLLAGCSSAPVQEQEPMNKNFFAMNTYISFTIYGDVPENVMELSEAKVNELEALWSVTRDDSEIYAINHADGEPITVSDETAELLRFSLEMGEQTGGALDVTIYPVLTAWGFTTGSYQIPSEELLAEKMQLVGYEKVSLKDNTVFLLPGMQLDFGAVAKGYACDLIRDLLRDNGVTSAIISLGGNICAIGSKPDGSDFRISVQHPDERNSLGILTLSDRCISTSGTYERYFVGEDGKEYGHILNPETGRPMQSDLISVTVVSEDGKLCDALSTSLFVKGLDGAIAYYREHDGFELLLMAENGELYLTDGLKDQFALAAEYQNIPVNVIGK